MGWSPTWKEWQAGKAKENPNKERCYHVPNMNSTDETAQKILALTGGDWVAINPSDDPYSDGGELTTKDLQAMAKLWLMRESIVDAVGTAINGGIGEAHHQALALYDKIQALEDNDE